MEENQMDKALMKRAWINALKTFGKIMLAVVVVFNFAVLALFFISPSVSAKFFGQLGLKRAQETSYELVYKRDDSLANLYNVVLCNIENGNFEKEYSYLVVLFKSDDYAEFCKGMDSAAEAEVKDKSLIPYYCDTNNFLLRRQVICMKNLNMSPISIMEQIKKYLGRVDERECTFACYVELILSDSSMANAEKVALLGQMQTTLFGSVDAKINSLKLQAQSEQNNVQKILLYYSLVQNLKGKYLCLEKLNDAGAAAVKTEYDSTQNEFNKLVG